MAVLDILAQVGDGQDFIVEIPAGNSSYLPQDVLLAEGGAPLLNEIPSVAGGSIFIMSE